tara:strand:+ start:266 stop:1138 length:873 start_codon:yes stop_codon:yes gene_type:complete
MDNISIQEDPKQLLYNYTQDGDDLVVYVALNNNHLEYPMSLNDSHTLQLNQFPNTKLYISETEDLDTCDYWKTFKENYNCNFNDSYCSLKKVRLNRFNKESCQTCLSDYFKKLDMNESSITDNITIDTKSLPIYLNIESYNKTPCACNPLYNVQIDLDREYSNDDLRTEFIDTFKEHYTRDQSLVQPLRYLVTPSKGRYTNMLNHTCNYSFNNGPIEFNDTNTIYDNYRLLIKNRYGNPLLDKNNVSLSELGHLLNTWKNQNYKGQLKSLRFESANKIMNQLPTCMIQLE